MRSSLLPCKRLRVPFFGGDGLLIGDIMSGVTQFWLDVVAVGHPGEETGRMHS